MEFLKLGLDIEFLKLDGFDTFDLDVFDLLIF